ncbi:hypothetical protein QJS10_CPB20g00084 [Acorus calamus]|uniref:Uncharacterized protein n=1 Tax=Acorus calamus TaxID=4465 RepID=A0AAV9CAC9_ACOCL|nr:hypothetical protein QJS10_CPB20g00084 [Acorus calamus]
METHHFCKPKPLPTYQTHLPRNPNLHIHHKTRPLVLKPPPTTRLRVTSSKPDHEPPLDPGRPIPDPPLDDEVGLVEEAEVLEGMEEEAMAGDDVGRGPGDYDRRAHLFDESSRVFRTLKEIDDPAHQG